jgi:hypothetical protein
MSYVNEPSKRSISVFVSRVNRQNITYQQCKQFDLLFAIFACTIKSNKNMEPANNSIIVEPSKNIEPQKIVKITKNPYKNLEYQKFIQTVKNGEIPEHWEMLAETLGIRPETISEWKKLPEFAEAVNRGLEEALSKMKEVGGKDWKQWRERVAILSREKAKDAGVVINADKVIAILGNQTKEEKVSYNVENEKVEAN